MNDKTKTIIKYVIAYGIVFFLGFFELPFYIDAPGGLDNLNNRVEVENAYKAKGSINLTYVKEIKATSLTSLIALINPNWKLEKKDQPNNGNLDYDNMMIRQQVLMKQSYTTAIKFAYEKAEKEVHIDDEDCYVIYVFDEAKTNLEVGDKIKNIDGNEVKSCTEISDYINNKKTGEQINFIVNEDENKEATLIEVDDDIYVGIQLATVYSLSTNPKYNFKFNPAEYGPSGGLMISLAVYNSLVETDITGGKKIAGTGTLNPDGTVGEIGGIDYKIKGAVKKKADVFFAPSGENYEEAKKIIEKNHYKIKLVEVSTFDDALNYLLNNVVKK